MELQIEAENANIAGKVVLNLTAQPLCSQTDQRDAVGRKPAGMEWRRFFLMGISLLFLLYYDCFHKASSSQARLGI